MLTGFEGPAFNAPDNQQQRRPAIGSAAARLRGANIPGMPPYVGVPHLRGGTDNLFHYAAYLGGGWNPFVVDRPIDPQDIAATIYHHLGIDAQAVTFRDHLDRPLMLLDQGQPIRELIG